MWKDPRTFINPCIEMKGGEAGRRNGRNGWSPWTNGMELCVMEGKDPCRSGAKAGHSGSVVPAWKCFIAHRDGEQKSGDRLKVSPRAHIDRGGLAPRCRPVSILGWRKVSGGVGVLRSPSTRGTRFVLNVVRQFRFIYCGRCSCAELLSTRAPKAEQTLA